MHEDGKKYYYPQHALMMNPVSAKKMVMLLQEAYPARPKVGLIWEFFKIRSWSYLIFTNIERLEMKITGNAFPQLSACNADGLQSHAGETSTMSMFKKNVDSTYNLIQVSFVYILMQMKPFQCFFCEIISRVIL